jgi:hypothetical protein
MAISISENIFEVDLRPAGWPDDPDVRRAAGWFSSYIDAAEWKRRRFAALERFVNHATSQPVADSAGDGRFYAADDQFGWYLFLAQAYVDHPIIYDYMYGSRVIPIFRAIGRNLDLINQVDGVEDRVRRIVGDEKAQPNGGLFELLVAAAYCREGATVKFLPERRGQAKTHDLDVSLDGKIWAVECKRMETGEYIEKERTLARELWTPVANDLRVREFNVLVKVRFNAELSTVPKDYFAIHAITWLKSNRQTPHVWSDEYSSGEMGTLDLTPLQSLLRTDDVALNSSRMLELLTGEYKRNAKAIDMMIVRLADNPLYIKECSHAIVFDWESRSTAAIDKKARDVLKRLSDGVAQLPDDRPGVVHIAFEAVDGMDVEAARFDKIKKSTQGFDARGKPLEFVCINWFAPESPPD